MSCLIPTLPFQITIFLLILGFVNCGFGERKLLNDLMAYYQKLERPVANVSEAVQLRFGLTLQQIMDVVSETSNFLMNKLLAIVNYNKVF